VSWVTYPPGAAGWHQASLVIWRQLSLSLSLSLSSLMPIKEGFFSLREW
jgi:hypothetical protein